MNYWVAIYRFAWVMLAILLTIGLVCIFLPKCHRLSELQEAKDQRAAENRAVESETSELRTKQEKFNSDPEFVERTARDTGMVKPDEVLFKFTNEQSGNVETPR